MTQNIKHSKNNIEAVLERSPIHAQSTWIKAIIKEVGKIDAAHVLIDSLIYNINKYKSFAINGVDEFGLLYCAKEYQEHLKVSYKRARAIPTDLVNDGWLESVDQRFTYNKKFYKPTSKALDFIYGLHLVQNDHIGDNGNIDKMALVPNGQTTCANLPKSYKDKKQDQKITIRNNQYQELESIGATENFDCFDCDGIVIFDFSEFGLEAIKCESILYDYFTVNQAKAINTIAHVNADKIDIVAFNNALARKDIKHEAKDFKQFVSWCYLVAVDAKGASEVKGSVTFSECDLSESVAASNNVNLGKVNHLSEKKADKNSNINRQMKLDLDAVINELKAILVDQNLEAITAKVLELESQYDIDSENELVAAVLVEFDAISEDDFLGWFDAASDLRNALPNQSLTSKEADNTNNASIVKGDNANNLVSDQAYYSEKNAESVTFVDGDSETGIASDLRNIGLKQSLTTENNTNALNVVAEDNADNNRFDQVNDSGNFEIVVDGVGLSEGESVGVSDVEVVGFGGDGKGQCRDSRETVTNDNGYQQSNVADNAVKNTETVVDQFLNLGESKYKEFVKLCLQRGFPSETKVIESATRAIRDYGKLNFDQLFKGICYGDFYGLKLIDSEAVTDIDDNNKKNQLQTKAKNPLSSNPSLNLPTLAELKMPVVEKEVIKKDWASLAQQSLGLAAVTECQKIALVAIIDYVKRKGVVITSDQEVYEWLYHTVANYEYYFSGATNFKHLANILIKRLVNKSFNRPSGFDTWRKMIGDGERVVSMDTDKKTNKKDLKNYSSEIDLLLGRINDKMNVTNPKKDVKKHQKKLYSNRRTGGFVV